MNIPQMNIPQINRFNLSDLIKYLNDIKDTHGDKPIEFWDQYEAVEINDLDVLTRNENDMIYLGGFLHCGKTTHSFVCDELDKGNFVYDPSS